MTKPTTWTHRALDGIVTLGLAVALFVNGQVMALPAHFV